MGYVRIKIIYAPSPSWLYKLIIQPQLVMGLFQMSPALISAQSTWCLKIKLKINEVKYLVY